MQQIIEAEKLLLTVYEANKLEIAISVKTINSYVYLLNRKYSLPFYYSFRFNPLPTSEDLIDDLESLKNGGNIAFSSPIVVTAKGKARIEQRLDTLRPFSQAVEKALNEMSKWDEKMLFRAIYNTITM